MCNITIDIFSDVQTKILDADELEERFLVWDIKVKVFITDSVNETLEFLVFGEGGRFIEVPLYYLRIGSFLPGQKFTISTREVERELKVRGLEPFSYPKCKFYGPFNYDDTGGWFTCIKSIPRLSWSEK